MLGSLYSLFFCTASRAANLLGPGKGPWQMETPEAHGLDSAALEFVKEYVFNKSFPPLTHRDCLVIIKDGALIFEEYSADSYNHTRHSGYSATKTLGALIAGAAVTHYGLDIDADIKEKYGVNSPRSYAVTARQIMSQALAGTHGPGENWRYDGIGVEWINRMTEVIKASTGNKSTEIWDKYFKSRLGFDSLIFPDADTTWATGSEGTCRDYARIGQLMLNKGAWLGEKEPIISAEYMHELSTPQTRYKPYDSFSNPCYGLLTWLTDVGKVNAGTPYPGPHCKAVLGPEWDFPVGSPSDVYFAGGMFGQIIMVMPSHNTVVVTMGFSAHANIVPTWIYEAFCKAKVFEDCDVGAHVIV